MAPTTSLLESLPAAGEVILRDGKPYVLCPSCEGTRLAQIAGDPFCTDCFGSGIAPVFEAARFAFARAQAAGQFVPSLDAPVRGTSSGGSKMKASPVTSSVKAATEAQISFLETLIRERMPHAEAMDDISRGFCREGLNTLRAIKGGKIIARHTMSDIITEVKQVKVPRVQTFVAPTGVPGEDGTPPLAQPVKPVEFLAPEGKFALPTDDGDVKFYMVEHGAEGSKWEGFTFLSAMASDDFHPIKNSESRKAICARIAADPLEAMMLYGKSIGKCGHCGKKLTSKWRLVGIGPKCAQRLGI